MTPGIVAESDLSGNLKSEYVFFDGDRVARKDFSGSTTSVSYYFSDHLKTASVITNSSGTITEDEDSYPWGGELQFVNNDSNHYKFTGKERDGETGLDYFGARYYGNWTGRFLTPDWAAKPASVPYADLKDPQSLNLYSYVRNRPMVMTDPDGHFVENNADKDKKLPAPDAQHDHTITVREVSGQGGNVFGHATVQVDGNKEVGYGPAQDMTTKQVVKNESVPGQVEPRAAGVKTEDQVTIHVTADQAKAAQKTIDDTAKNPGNYTLHGDQANNCATFAEHVVNNAGGHAPNDTTPGGLVSDIRAQQYKDKSTQTH